MVVTCFGDKPVSVFFHSTTVPCELLSVGLVQQMGTGRREKGYRSDSDQMGTEYRGNYLKERQL